MRVGLQTAQLKHAAQKGVEQRLAKPVALGLARQRLQPLVQMLAGQVLHRQYAFGREFWQRLRHDDRVVVELLAKPDELAGLVRVVQLFSQLRFDVRQHLLDHVGLGQCLRASRKCSQQATQELQVAADRLGHARVLQLNRYRLSTVGGGSVDLTQAGGGKGLRVERGKQFVGGFAKGFTHQLDDQSAVQRCGLVVRFGKFGAHTVWQEPEFHAQQLRGLQRGAFQLVQRAEQDAPEVRLMVCGR